jgi:hypothetical protein
MARNNDHRIGMTHEGIAVRGAAKGRRMMTTAARDAINNHADSD